MWNPTAPPSYEPIALSGQKYWHYQGVGVT